MGSLLGAGTRWEGLLGIAPEIQAGLNSRFLGNLLALLPQGLREAGTREGWSSEPDT